MTFDEYQKQSRKTAKYPNAGKNFIYPALGLCGESGEVAEKIKKVWRDKNCCPDEKEKNGIAKELGDVLWYLSQIASELNLSLEEIGLLNIEKSNSRHQRNKINGSGDNR